MDDLEKSVERTTIKLGTRNKQIGQHNSTSYVPEKLDATDEEEEDNEGYVHHYLNKN